MEGILFTLTLQTCRSEDVYFDEEPVYAGSNTFKMTFSLVNFIHCFTEHNLIPFVILLVRILTALQSTLLFPWISDKMKSGR